MTVSNNQPDAGSWDVFLDGEWVGNVEYADEEAGFVMVRSHIPGTEADCLVQRRRGRVQIVPLGEKPAVEVTP